MGSISLPNHVFFRRSLATAALVLGLAGAAQATVSVEGSVLDINGRPVGQAQVTLDWGPGAHGATAVTVFTNERGRFSFPQAFANASSEKLPVTVRALGFEQLRTATSFNGSDEIANLTIVMRRVANQAAVAPSSAWLDSVQDPEDVAVIVQNCVSCHQFPAPEVRDFATAIHDMHGNSGPALEQSWSMSVKYMNYLYVEEFARGNPKRKVDVQASYWQFPVEPLAKKITELFPGRMDYVEDYDWGAPLIVTPDTVISEYEVPDPNAIREAVLIGSDLWIADVNSDDLIRVNRFTGDQRVFTVPSDVPVGPHTLNKGSDGSLWVTGLFNGIVAQLVDPENEEWRVWPVKDEKVRGVGIHDVTFDPKHEALTDTEGRLWYSNIAANAVGYFHPETGAVGNYIAPEIPGRPSARAQLYGALMESDRKHVWYSQLGIGAFGSFNTETLEFEELVVMPSINAGPRRLTISEEDILYVPMFGGGQLVEYDTQARKQIGIYDLPDRGSAPYAVTWDPVRQVVWIATSNADVIYRFDPSTKEFGVLPLPRQRAYLRMLQVDPDTGVLVSSYGNVPIMAYGRRMAFIIDPGDGAYDKKQQLSRVED